MSLFLERQKKLPGRWGSLVAVKKDQTVDLKTEGYRELQLYMDREGDSRTEMKSTRCCVFAIFATKEAIRYKTVSLVSVQITINLAVTAVFRSPEFRGPNCRAFTLFATLSRCFFSFFLGIDRFWPKKKLAV